MQSGAKVNYVLQTMGEGPAAHLSFSFYTPSFQVWKKTDRVYKAEAAPVSNTLTRSPLNNHQIKSSLPGFNWTIEALLVLCDSWKYRKPFSSSSVGPMGPAGVLRKIVAIKMNSSLIVSGKEDTVDHFTPGPECFICATKQQTSPGKKERLFRLNNKSLVKRCGTRNQNKYPTE